MSLDLLRVKPFNPAEYSSDVVFNQMEGLTVYRVDNRSPNELMVNGFSSRGDDYDISQFVLSPSDNAGFISTTTKAPEQILREYQLRGFVLDSAMEIGVSAGKVSIMDHPPVFQFQGSGLQENWGYGAIEGEGTTYIYVIELAKGQGIDVENSTFTYSERHKGQAEIAVSTEIKTEKVKGVYELNVNFPLNTLDEVLNILKDIEVKTPSEALDVKTLVERCRKTDESLWEGTRDFNSIFDGKPLLKKVNIKLMVDINTKLVKGKIKETNYYYLELSASDAEAAGQERKFRTIEIKTMDDSLILGKHFSKKLVDEIISDLYVGKNRIKSSNEFESAEPARYKTSLFDEKIIVEKKFSSRTKKAGVLGESIDFSVWEFPDKEDFIQAQHQFNEADHLSNYEKTLIVQLQGDDTSFDAAIALSLKNIYTSELLQIRSEAPAEVFTWVGRGQEFGYTSPLKLDKEGKIRITLVGHGETEDGVTTLGGMTAEVLKGHLTRLFARLDYSRSLIKGVKLNLTGCSLLDPQLALPNTLPGQLALWLKDQAEALGLSHDAWSVSARESELMVLENGKKEMLINDNWINKEVAELHNLVYKTELVWNEKTNSLDKLPLSIDELQEVTSDIDDAIANHAQLDKNSATLLEEMHRQVSQRISELLLLNEKHDSHRTEIETRVNELMDLVNLGNEWNDAANLLHQQNNLEEHWHTTFTVVEGEHGSHQVLFVNSNNDKVMYINTSEPIFSKFSQQYDKLLGHFSGLILDKESGKVIAKPGVLEGEAAHTMNAAFMLQTLMNVNPENGGLNALSWPLQLQTYTQLAQNTLGLAHDAAAVINLVKLASSTELKPLSAATSLLGTVAPGVLGLFLDAANILGMSFQLSDATDPVEINTTVANLTLTGLMVGTNIAALLTSLSVGTAAVSGLLGMVAVPLAGIAAGLPTLVGNYTSLAEQTKATFSAFDAIQTSVSLPNKLRKLSDEGQSPVVWGLASGAVVDSVNFRDNTVHFGSVTSVGSRGGSEHTYLGNWDSYCSGPLVDYQLRLDLYRGLGLQNPTQALNFLSDAQIFLLPGSAQRHYTFDYDEAPGVRYKNPSALITLGEYFKEQFKWGFYALPTDWAVTRLRAELASTPINVQLDATPRTLIIPTLLDDNERSKIFYQLVGDGGQYTVMLPSKAIAITVTPSNLEEERWVFDIESLIKESSTVDNKIVLGALLPERINAITLQNNSLSIGSQRLLFNGKPPVHLLLESRLTLKPAPTQTKNLAVLTLVLSFDEQNLGKSYVLLFSDEAQLEMYAEQILQAAKPLASVAAQITLIAGKSKGVVDIANNRLWLVQEQGQLLLCEGNRLSRCRFPKGAQALIGPKSMIMASGKIDDLSFTAILDQRAGQIEVSLVYLESQIADVSTFSLEPFQNFADKNHSSALDALVKLYPGSFSRENLAFNSDGVWRFASKQGEGFSFAAQGAQLAIGNANWSNAQADFVYSNLYSTTAKALEVKAKPATTLLNLSKQQMTLDWLDKNTQIIVVYQDTLSSIELELSQIRAESIYIVGPSRKTRLTLNIIDQAQESMLLSLDDNDLVMRSSHGQTVKLANAMSMEQTLFLSFLNSTTMSLQKIKESILFSSNKPITQILKYFNLEPVISAELVGEQYHVIGRSGLRYESPKDIAAANQAATAADAADIAHALATAELISQLSMFPWGFPPNPTLSNRRAFAVVGHQGQQTYSIPQGIRSLSILLNIINGGTVFNGLEVQGVNLDRLFPETGEEALYWLQQAERFITMSGSNDFTHRLLYGNYNGQSSPIDYRTAQPFINNYLNTVIKQGAWIAT